MAKKVAVRICLSSSQSERLVNQFMKEYGVIKATVSPLDPDRLLVYIEYDEAKTSPS